MSLKKTFAEYLEIPAINWSTLKEMARSPLHYQHRLANPREDSAGLARGRAIHTAVLEPEKFSEEYVVFDGPRRAGKAWDEFEVAHTDKTILKKDEYDKAWHAAIAVKRHPEVVALMRKGKPEQSFTWKNQETGLKCKCRVDWKGEVLFDLKSTGDVDARKFGNIAARMMYYGQLAMYRDGAKHDGEVFMAVVEAEPPFDVAVFKLSDDDLLAGKELYTGFLKRVVECKKAGVWPGRYLDRQTLELPRYVFEDDAQEDGTSVVVE